MIPILYSLEETAFESNGLGRLSDCVSCTVTEERNGIYECEFQYPITGRWYSYLVETGGIVGVIHDDTKTVQPFEVYSYSAPINGIVTFYAHHISYRLNNVLVKPFTASSVSDLMSKIVPNSVVYNPFTFWTDKVVARDYVLDHPENCRAMLGGHEGSILDTYGKGEYEFDKFAVKLYLNRGVDTNVTIRYGKNLVDIVKDYDRSGIYTGIAPYWSDGQGLVVTLPEIYVMSSNAPADNLSPWTDNNGNTITDNNGTPIEFKYVEPLIVPMDFSASFEEAPSVNQLRSRAVAYLSNNQPWIPDESISVNFVQLWQTPEYENVAALQRVSLCDTVSVYYPELGVVAENQKIIKVVYNVLTERFDSMELGKPKISLAETIESAVYEETEKATSTWGSVLQAAIDKATKLITGGLGGHVVFNLNANGEPQEILIMDTDDIQTAVKVLRINKNGIGFSQSGYSGQYDTAWTIDGAFNASYITAGQLDATLIRAGTLADLAGKFSFDLISGNIVMNNAVLNNATMSGTLQTVAQVSTGWMMAMLTSGNLGLYFSTDGNAYSLIGNLRANRDGNGNYVTELFSALLARYLHLYTGQTGQGDIYITRNEAYTDADFGVPCKIYAIGNTCFADDVKIIGGLSAPDITSLERIEFSYGSGQQPPEFTLGTSSGRRTLWFSNADFYVTQNFTCSGTKSRSVDTPDYGKRSLYCYETPSPLFGDVGEGEIDETGVCYVWLDPILTETIRTTSYQVFLQQYGSGTAYVSERTGAYFVVTGTPGMKFGWELKAKQSDFAEKRLEKDFGNEEVSGTDYAEEAYNYIRLLREGRIA